MDVVRNGEILAGARRTSSETCGKVVLGVLDEQRRIVVVVYLVSESDHEVGVDSLTISIDVEVDHMVSQFLHVTLTARCGSAVRVRRPHVSGEKAENVSQSHLIAPHLLLSLQSSQVAQIRVGPGMARDLVPFVVRSLNDRRPRVRSVVNLSFAIVVACNEESCLGAVVCKNIQNVVSVDVRAVIERDGNGSFNCAVVYSCSTVWNATKQWSSNG